MRSSNVTIGVTLNGEVSLRVDGMELTMTPEMARWLSFELTAASKRADDTKKNNGVE